MPKSTARQITCKYCSWIGVEGDLECSAEDLVCPSCGYTDYIGWLEDDEMIASRNEALLEDAWEMRKDRTNE